MPRQIVLDTETTGLDPNQGHRIIEIGLVELFNRRLTGRQFHHYINPDRDSDPGALAVHGLTTEFLRDKPRIETLIHPFLEFINGAELIIHNAKFDLSFIRAEFARSQQIFPDDLIIIDTLDLARQKYPGQKNNLDALCKRHNVNNTHRQLHGALLDATLLAHVYLAMTGGQQSLFAETQDDTATSIHENIKNNKKYSLKVIRASAEELALHGAKLEKIRA